APAFRRQDAARALPEPRRSRGELLVASNALPHSLRSVAASPLRRPGPLDRRRRLRDGWIPEAPELARGPAHRRLRLQRNPRTFARGARDRSPRHRSRSGFYAARRTLRRDRLPRRARASGERERFSAGLASQSPRERSPAPHDACPRLPYFGLGPTAEALSPLLDSRVATDSGDQRLSSDRKLVLLLLRLSARLDAAVHGSIRRSSGV